MQSIDEIEAICERDAERNSPYPWLTQYWDGDQEEDGWDTCEERKKPNAGQY